MRNLYYDSLVNAYNDGFTVEIRKFKSRSDYSEWRPVKDINEIGKVKIHLDGGFSPYDFRVKEMWAR